MSPYEEDRTIRFLRRAIVIGRSRINLFPSLLSKGDIYDSIYAAFTENLLKPKIYVEN